MTTVVDAVKGEPAPWLDGIEGDAARELIESNARVIRVVAGPGSGKTTCLKRRIQRLVQKDEADPTTMFRRKHSRERLQKSCEKHSAQRSKSLRYIHLPTNCFENIR